MSIDDNNFEIVFNDAISNQSEVFSERYNFNVDDIEKCNYLRKYRQLQIITNSQYFKFNESLVEKGKTRVRNIKFRLPKSIEKDILREIDKRVFVEYFD